MEGCQGGFEPGIGSESQITSKISFRNQNRFHVSKRDYFEFVFVCLFVCFQENDDVVATQRCENSIQCQNQR